MFQIHAIIIIFFSILFSCNAPEKHRVEIEETDAGYQLYRNGEPYYIRGAGIEAHYKMLAESGGNSIRTWGINQWDDAFRQAEKYGFTVCAGMWLDQEQQGFDHNDAEAVNKQFKSFKSAILKYRDHPPMTATAFIEKEEVELILERCPHIDILAVNAYAGLPHSHSHTREYGILSTFYIRI
jgi:hypothetical protein